MLLHFSENKWERWRGVIYYNRQELLTFIALAVAAYLIYNVLGIKDISLPVAPVSIIGVGLAIFLGFRNSSAYDRWWEARKIWGGIVNASRSWGMQVCNHIQSSELLSKEQTEAARRDLVYRHIAWLYALTLNLRKKMDIQMFSHLLSEEEASKLSEYKNIPAQLINNQAKELESLYKRNSHNDFRHRDLHELLVEFYALQGKAERIKNTVFPFYYNYFTKVFLWLFLIILPLALVDTMSWEFIPLSVAISFVFHILDKSGNITEEPFEGRAADTPMISLCRTIEIDLRQMLNETVLPEPNPPKFTRFNAAYLD